MNKMMSGLQTFQVNIVVKGREHEVPDHHLKIKFKKSMGVEKSLWME